MRREVHLGDLGILDLLLPIDWPDGHAPNKEGLGVDEVAAGTFWADAVLRVVSRLIARLGEIPKRYLICRCVFEPCDFPKGISSRG